MSVIFFDGFDREIDTHYWSLVGANNTDNFGNFFNSYLQFTPSNNYESVAKLRLWPHVPVNLLNKKLYIGVRVSNYDILTSPVESPIAQPFIKFVDKISGVAAFEIRWSANQNPGYPFAELSLYGPDGENARFVIAPQSVGGIETVQAAYLQNSNRRYLFAPTYQTANGISNINNCESATTRTIEFEIDVPAQRIKIRFEGQQLIDEFSGEDFGILGLSNNFWMGFDGLDIHGSQTCAAKLHDIYIVDSSGDYANTWLGHDFAVVPATFTPTEPAILNEWVEVSVNTNINNGDLLNSNDADISYIATNFAQNKQAYKIIDNSPVYEDLSDPAVAGMRATNIAKKTNNSKLLYPYVYIAHNTGNATTKEMGQLMRAGTTQYSMQKTQFIDKDPHTGAQWALENIRNFRGFGLKLKQNSSSSSESNSSEISLSSVSTPSEPSSSLLSSSSFVVSSENLSSDLAPGCLTNPENLIAYCNICPQDIETNPDNITVQLKWRSYGYLNVQDCTQSFEIQMLGNMAGQEGDHLEKKFIADTATTGSSLLTTFFQVPAETGGQGPVTFRIRALSISSYNFSPPPEAIVGEWFYFPGTFSKERCCCSSCSFSSDSSATNYACVELVGEYACVELKGNYACVELKSSSSSATQNCCNWDGNGFIYFNDSCGGFVQPTMFQQVGEHTWTANGTLSCGDIYSATITCNPDIPYTGAESCGLKWSFSMSVSCASGITVTEITETCQCDVPPVWNWNAEVNYCQCCSSSSDVDVCAIAPLATNTTLWSATGLLNALSRYDTISLIIDVSGGSTAEAAYTVFRVYSTHPNTVADIYNALFTTAENPRQITLPTEHLLNTIGFSFPPLPGENGSAGYPTAPAGKYDFPVTVEVTNCSGNESVEFVQLLSVIVPEISSSSSANQ